MTSEDELLHQAIALFIFATKQKPMEIVSIEVETFKEMKTALNNFSTIVRQVVSNNPSKTMNEWLDNQDVCLLLKISQRTLQNLRDNGSIPYTQIKRKTFYKQEDVLRFIEKRRCINQLKEDNL